MSEVRAVTPVLLVSDVVRAARYYSDKLGFATPRLWGDPPAFAIPGRDGMQVMLDQVNAGDAFQPNSAYEGRYDVYFDMADADALYEEFKAKGADVVCAPEDQIYAMREFSVRDPGGRLSAFGHGI